MGDKRWHGQSCACLDLPTARDYDGDDGHGAPRAGAQTAQVYRHEQRRPTGLPAPRKLATGIRRPPDEHRRASTDDTARHAPAPVRHATAAADFAFCLSVHLHSTTKRVPHSLAESTLFFTVFYCFLLFFTVFYCFLRYVCVCVCVCVCVRCREAHRATAFVFNA